MIYGFPVARLSLTPIYLFIYFHPLFFFVGRGGDKSHFLETVLPSPQVAISFLDSCQFLNAGRQGRWRSLSPSHGAISTHSADISWILWFVEDGIPINS